jgi:hypothetical protein
MEAIIMIADLLIYGVTLFLAAIATGMSFCRIAAIDMKGVQYRYVAPFVLIFVGSLGVAVSLLGGDRASWFQPLLLLAFVIYLWNTKVDWVKGMPENYNRKARIMRSALPTKTRHRVVFENAAVALVTILAIGAAGVGSAAGRGNPIQVYSAYAKPPVAFPGQDLSMLVTYRRLRVCPGYASRFIVSQETGEIAQRFDQMPIGGSEVGRKYVDKPVVLSLDAALQPGRYAYRAILYSNCSDANYTQVIPDVPFVVAVSHPN